MAEHDGCRRAPVANLERAAVAAQAIALGIVADTAPEIATAMTTGTGTFGRGVAWRLALQGAALGAAVLVVSRL